MTERNVYLLSFFNNVVISVINLFLSLCLCLLLSIGIDGLLFILSFSNDISLRTSISLSLLSDRLHLQISIWCRHLPVPIWPCSSRRPFERIPRSQHSPRTPGPFPGRRPVTPTGRRLSSNCGTSSKDHSNHVSNRPSRCTGWTRNTGTACSFRSGWTRAGLQQQRYRSQNNNRLDQRNYYDH